jgi:hypothetical protein
MSPEAREDFVIVSDVLNQHRNRIFFRHAVQGLAAASTDGFEYRRFVVPLKLGLLNSGAEIAQMTALPLAVLGHNVTGGNGRIGLKGGNSLSRALTSQWADHSLY